MIIGIFYVSEVLDGNYSTFPLMLNNFHCSKSLNSLIISKVKEVKNLKNLKRDQMITGYRLRVKAMDL